MDTLYFKDMSTKNEAGVPQVMYRVEAGKIFTEILDPKHPCGCCRYFSSIQRRNSFIEDKKDHILRINEKEVKEIVAIWKQQA